MKTPRLLSSVAILLLAGSPALADCPPSDHDCFNTGSPGCSDADCCQAVCAEDPFCCEAAWDGSCVNRAFVLCGAPPCDFTCPKGAIDEGEPCGEDTNGGCNVPIVGGSDCCHAHGAPGCDDLGCEIAVCAFENYCCDIEWDGYCVQLSLELCPDTCTLGAPSFTTLECGKTICGTAWASGGTHDTDWYQVVVSTTRELTFTANSQLDIKIGLVDNDGVPSCDGPLAQSPFANTGFCGTASFTACLTPGTYWLVVTPTSYDGFPCDSGFNQYSISLACGGTCVPPTCGAPNTGSCFEPHGAPYCADQTCCETVCAVNPYCCDVAWDASCVGEAETYCVTCDLPNAPGTVSEVEACGEDTNGGCNLPVLGKSSCCIANGGLGCDDPVCEDAVCAFDSFCCEVAWDAICASYSPYLCPELCPLGEPAFEPISCGMTIRGTAWAENGVKDTDWYSITVKEVTPITFTGVAQFPLVIGLSDTGGFGGCLPGTGYPQLNPYVLANPCVETSFTTCLEPGTWYLFVAPQITFNWPCKDPGCDCPDLNDSGAVDANDLAILLGAWGTVDPCADLDGSGAVGAADLAVLLGAWGPYQCAASKNGYVVSLSCGGECTGPSNDFCQDAAPIGLGDTNFSTAGATSGGPLLPISCDEGFGTVFVRDIWFKYVPESTGVLTVSTCGQASFDTRLAGYTGTCGNLELVGCNDDTPDCWLNTSTMQFIVFEGQTYYLRVGSYADTGPGTLTLTLD